jgi:hypothetical protein
MIRLKISWLQTHGPCFISPLGMATGTEPHVAIRDKTGRRTIEA